MLMVTWSGAKEASGEAPGLSRYDGDSSLKPIVDEGTDLERGDCGHQDMRHGQLSLWGTAPRRLSVAKADLIRKYLALGVGVRTICRRVKCSTATVARIRKGRA
uniref:Uncharacterized protein n=1 Tax=viral metagenome TaxID=1070528 RepID=A0A6M3J9C5_9ZZZZ